MSEEKQISAEDFLGPPEQYRQPQTAQDFLGPQQLYSEELRSPPGGFWENLFKADTGSWESLE
jgi:hypothetical protein